MKKCNAFFASLVILINLILFTACGGKNNEHKQENNDDNLSEIQDELLKKLSVKIIEECMSFPAIVMRPYQEIPNSPTKGSLFFDGEKKILNQQSSYYSTQADVFRGHLSWETVEGKISDIEFITTDYVKGKKIPMLKASWKSNNGQNIATLNIVPVLYQDKSVDINGSIQYALYTDKWRIMGNRIPSQKEFYDILNLLGKLSKVDVSNLKITNGSIDSASVTKNDNKTSSFSNDQIQETNSEGNLENESKSSEFNHTNTTEKRLSKSELINYSKSELRLIRNEIFARHGYIFKSKDLAEYFSKKTWYKPQFNNVMDKLSSIERNNIALIESIEKK